MRKSFIILLLILFTGCQKQPLTVFTEYVSLETLPSYLIGTPDPRLYCPDYGQKLHISWSVPLVASVDDLDLSLHLKLRFGNKEDFEEWITLNSLSGIYVFPLLNEEYWSKKGIFTYKVELYSHETLLYTWRHQLWAEKIQLDK